MLCKKCQVEKPDSEFNRKSNSKTGFNGSCKACCKIYNRSYRDRNKANLSEKKKHYHNRPEVKERQKNYHREYRSMNSDVLKERAQKYRDSHKEVAKELKKQWYMRNKERVAPLRKAYRDSHKQQKRAADREYRKRRYHTDELFKLRLTIKRQMQRAFKYIKEPKSHRVMDTIGCGISELRFHLETTFFFNYGVPYNGEYVHIDHIIPISTAKTEEDILRLNHYTNLQYLLAKDNLSKSNKENWEISNGREFNNQG